MDLVIFDPVSNRFPREADTTAVPDPAPAVVPSNDGTGTSDAKEEGKSDWKSNAFTTAKLLLRAVSSASDAFGPLKSVSGGLCFILDNCEVWFDFRMRHLQG